MRPWLIVLVACHRDPGPATVANRVAAVPVDAPPPTTCVRYRATADKAIACMALTKDVRDRIAQARTDLQASLAENGLDGGEHIDPDEACEEELAKVVLVAGRVCAL